MATTSFSSRGAVFFSYPLNLELAVWFDLASSPTNVTQTETWKVLVHGACPLLLPLGTLQLPPGEQAWTILLHDKRKGPSYPVTLSDSPSIFSWLQIYEWVQLIPTEELPSWTQPKFLIPTQGMRSWCILYVNFSSRTNLTHSCLNVYPLTPYSIQTCVSHSLRFCWQIFIKTFHLALLWGTCLGQIHGG